MHRADRIFAERLRKRIATCGKSVYSIAQATKIAQPILSRFINGERTLNADTARKLARYLGVKEETNMPDDKKQSAKVLLDMLDHAKAEEEYIDEHIAKMDNPAAKRDLEKYKRLFLHPRVQELKSILNTAHPELGEEVESQDESSNGRFDSINKRGRRY